MVIALKGYKQCVTEEERLQRKRENHRRWHERHPNADKEYYKANRERNIYTAWVRRLKVYGLTPEKYEEILKKQEHGCAICRRPPTKKKRLSVDHCHKTGEVRGLLCFECNFHLIGFIERHEVNPYNITKYLRRTVDVTTPIRSNSR